MKLACSERIIDTLMGNKGWGWRKITTIITKYLIYTISVWFNIPSKSALKLNILSILCPHTSCSAVLDILLATCRPAAPTHWQPASQRSHDSAGSCLAVLAIPLATCRPATPTGQIYQNSGIWQAR